MEKEVLRLFKGFLGEKSNEVNELGLKYGLLIPKSANKKVVDEAIEMYGKDGVKWNNTFHKDFETVKNASIEDLIIQQLIHYITTYGFESLGVYDAGSVYIPKEKLEIPELSQDIEFIAIVPLTSEEISNKLMTLLTSGIALSKQSIIDIMKLSDYIDKNNFDDIINREIKIALYDKYNVMPKNPEEFLRYMMFKLTDTTLKIQSDDMIKKIKDDCDKVLALEMLTSYLENTPNGYEKLSSIFLRNKNLFLALKINKNSKHNAIRTQMNAIINKLRKYAIKNHKPLNKNILDCLTDKNQNINLEELSQILDNITIFREIRILNGILYRINGNDSIVYKIRNGKSYVKTLEPKTTEYITKLQSMEKIIRMHLINRLAIKVKNKTICIPDNVTYAAPTSEKQFNGNIPEGSYLEIPRDGNLVYGIHWTNIANNGDNVRTKETEWYDLDINDDGEERVDLDLKQMNKGEVFGWDASYRSANADVLFSGDMTNAPLPNGATELFYIGQNYGYGAFLITLNMFTDNSKDVPFEFVIAKATHTPNNRVNYVLDPNNILEKVNMVVKKDNKQMVVGFITIGDTIRFYFNDFSAGVSRRISKQDDITMGAFNYLQAYSKTQLKLNDLLKEAGAEVTNQKQVTVFVSEVGDDGFETHIPKQIDVDIDLSPNVITKESLINLLS